MLNSPSDCWPRSHLSGSGLLYKVGTAACMRIPIIFVTRCDQRYVGIFLRVSLCRPCSAFTLQWGHSHPHAALRQVWLGSVYPINIPLLCLSVFCLCWLPDKLLYECPLVKCCWTMSAGASGSFRVCFLSGYLTGHKEWWHHTD